MSMLMPTLNVHLAPVAVRTKLPEAAVHDRQLGVTAVTHGRIRSVAR
jgi:hypothetical protein